MGSPSESQKQPDTFQITRPLKGVWNPDLRDAILATEEQEDLERWRHATMQEKGEAFLALQRFVDKVGNFPVPETEFPGFPRHLRSQPKASDHGASSDH